MCSGDHSGTGGMDCVLKDVSNTVLFFSCLVCVAAVCAVGFLVGIEPCIVCWRMFLIQCCFLFPLLCGGCVCSGVSSGTRAVDCVLEDVSNTMLFSLVSCLVCVAAVCAVGILVGLVAWIVCWRMFLIPCCFLLPSVCGGCVCIGNFSGTSGVDCVGGCFYYYVVFCSLVCVAAVGAVGFLVGLVAWIECWRKFLILC